MMVAGFRGTLYRSYEFPSPTRALRMRNVRTTGSRYSGENNPGVVPNPLLAPRDPGQTNDGQFTSNRKNFLKLGLK